MPYSDDTLVVLVISIPSMFELLFKPYLMHRYSVGELDPLDKCFKELFDQIKRTFPKMTVEAIHDFEVHHNRKPKVLVQTAGHVSGAAYYYQRTDVSNDPWDKATKIYGVSVHPKYGGWFAFRGVLIFKDCLVGEELQKERPLKCVSSEKRIVELLEKYNFHWKDWTFRDILDSPLKERYSPCQKEYFATLPKDRDELLNKWLQSTNL